MKVSGGIAEEEVENEEANSSRPGDHSGLEDLNNAGIFSSGPIQEDNHNNNRLRESRSSNSFGGSRDFVDFKTKIAIF